MMMELPSFCDASAVAELRLILSEEELEQLMSAFIVELRTRPALIAGLIKRGDFRKARAEAHRFVGGASYFGITPFTVIAGEMELLPDNALPTLASKLKKAVQTALSDGRR